MIVAINKGFLKDIKRLPREIKNEVDKLIEELEREKSVNDISYENGKLKGEMKEYRKIYVREYRVIADYNPPNIELLQIGHRQGIYK